MNAWYTRLIWLGAFSFASASILVWVIPARFRDMSRPSRWPMRRRQALYSACALAFSAFCVYYALTQYPDIKRSLWDVVVMGLTNCPLAAAAITGWIYLVGQIVRRASKRAFVARPASGDLPTPFDQPRAAAPQGSAPPGPASYDPIGMSGRRAADRWLLQAADRLARGARALGAAEEAASSPSRLGFGIAVVVVITVVSIVGYVRSLGPWFSDYSPTSDELYSVAMASPTDGWAVGESGTILHYHDGSWSGVSSPTNDQLLSVAMVSPTDGWAVGDGGAILHYSGGSWSRVSSPTSLILFSVAMDSPTDGWAVGERGIFLHYHGGSWSSAGNLSSYILRGVAMLSPTDGWAVGEVGTILQYHDGSWSSVSSPIKLLFSVAMVSPTEGWAVGGGGTILHYSGGQ